MGGWDERVEMNGQNSSKVRSAVAGGGNGDIDVSGGALGSLPEDLVAVLGEGVGALDVGAGRDLEVVVAVVVTALQDLAVDADDGAPAGGLGALVGVAGEVELAGLSEVLEPLAGAAAVLADGDVLVGLDVLDGCVVAVVEVLQVGVELVGDHGHLALHGLVDGGQLAVERVLAVVDGEVGRADHLSALDDLLHLQDQLAVEQLRNGDHLSVSLIAVRVQLNHGAVPAGVIDLPEADFGSDGGPPSNAAIVIVPSGADSGAAEIAVEDEIGGVVGGGEPDVVDGEAVGIAEGGAVEGEDVVAGVEGDAVGGVVDAGAAGLAEVEGVEDEVVPDDVAHGGVEGGGAVGASDGPVELELVGEGGAGEGVVAGSDVAGRDLVVLVVEGEVLRDLVVHVAVQLAHLSGSAAVGVGAESDLNSSSLPSADVVEDAPRAVDVRGGEVAVDDDVCSGSLSDQLDVVDQQTVGVRDACADELERVFAGLDSDCEAEGVPGVVARHHTVNDDIVKDHFSEAASEGHSGSAGVLEGEGELAGEGA